ncbi:zinc finger protein 271-like [Ruditapes philippinarum]|uniref:zinc finger protein 271-like n=1 Tax=Ruditapes philippinarum TaxID=129788 RepID=UPI00295C1A8C|nr:zinc finger protein 271-like [Ruditapes philippinarum]
MLIKIYCGFICKFCGKRERSNVALEIHMRKHTGEKPYACTYCEKRFANKIRLSGTGLRIPSTADDNMTSQIVSIAEKFRCQFCNKVNGSRLALERHMLTHTGERNHVCTVSLDAGIDNVARSGGRGPLSLQGCPFCRKVFLSKHDRMKHIRKHTGPWVRTSSKLYKCEHCEKSYTSEYRLKYHVSNIHTQLPKRNTVCVYCSKRFSIPKSLKRHIATVHMGVKKYECETCDKKYGRKQDLQCHNRQHHSSPKYTCVLNAVGDQVSLAGMKAYRCNICNKICASQIDLDRHMRKHTGEKPYVCHVCSKAFSQTSNMYTHMRMRHGLNIQKKNN